MNWDIELLEHTPNGALSCLDVAWGQIAPQPMFFVMDATLANPESAGLNPPRARLLKVLGSCWPCLRDLSPLEALREIGNNFLSLNEVEYQHSFHAAAAMGRMSQDGSEWDLAECGDTKIYKCSERLSAPVWIEDIPADDHRVAGLLGSSLPLIRSARIKLDLDEEFAIFTDGAYHALAHHDLITPQSFNRVSWNRFNSIKNDATDDATMLRISPQS